MKRKRSMRRKGGFLGDPNIVQQSQVSANPTYNPLITGNADADNFIRKYKIMTETSSTAEDINKYINIGMQQSFWKNITVEAVRKIVGEENSDLEVAVANSKLPTEPVATAGGAKKKAKKYRKRSFRRK